ncbi:MAG: ABC transporter permease [Candidatus Altiarchaeota archaeon]
MLADYLRYATHSLISRGLRTWLTMLGIFVGIAAVVALISLGQGLNSYIDTEFQKIGVNRIIIVPGGGGFQAFQPGLSSAKLVEHDLDVILSARGVDTGIGFYRKVVNVEFQGETKTAFLMGVEFTPQTLEYMKTIDYMKVDEGRYLTPTDRYNAIIARTQATEEFKKEVKRGDKITVDGTDFTIVGFTPKTGNPQQDKKLIIPLETLRTMYPATDREINMVTISSNKGFNVTEVAQNVKTSLRRDHGLKEGEEDFTVQTAEQVMQTFMTIIGVVQTVLTGIAAISLLVGGLGIMTTMYTSVLERTNQIGIMKAVGAKNDDILALFLIEAGLLGLVGGMIGVLMGLSISFGVAYVAQTFYGIDLLHASADPLLIVGALAFSFVVGCLSGLMPARGAANMKPVDAIRSR